MRHPELGPAKDPFGTQALLSKQLHKMDFAIHDIDLEDPDDPESVVVSVDGVLRKEIEVALSLITPQEQKCVIGRVRSLLQANAKRIQAIDVLLNLSHTNDHIDPEKLIEKRNFYTRKNISLILIMQSLHSNV